MRAEIRAAIVLLAIPAAGLPAGAAELYKHGPVVCSAAAPSVKGLTVDGCLVNKAPDGGFYEGICEGSLAVGSRTIAFSARGEARRIDYTYPDNDTALSFDYAGLTCAVESRRLKTVQDCVVGANGLSKACRICVITGAKVCFDVKLDVTVLPSKTKTAAK